MKTKTIISGVLFAGIYLLGARTFACDPPCPPCYVLDDLECVWNCLTNDECCGGVCCSEPCCGGDCCNGDCEICVEDECLFCGGIAGMSCCDGIACYDSTSFYCCEDGNGNVCLTDTTCCGEECCIVSELCCDELTCYDPDVEQCCCFGTGLTCQQPCCSSWDCELCEWWFNECVSCLRKADDYDELSGCNCVDDPDHEPTANGCGAAGGPSVPDNPTGCEDTSFLDACNAHDICYGTCNSNKGSCDSGFLNAMLAVCMESSCAYACSQNAYAYYGAVHEYGQSAYESAQVEACACCDC